MDAAEDAKERHVERQNAGYTTAIAADWFTDEVAMQVNIVYARGEGGEDLKKRI